MGRRGRGGGETVTDDEMWAAVAARDRASDGVFVYGVISTGVFCRPSCPSRRPRRDRARFFATPSQAAAAGFRACLRCQPDTPNDADGERTLREAAAYLDGHPDEAITLAQLAVRVGLSPGHLQRAFTARFGVSPKRYQTALRAEALRRALRSGGRVDEAAYRAGFGSSRALYESAGRELGMSPAQYRDGAGGLVIRYTIVSSALGPVLVGRTDRGVCAVLLDEAGSLPADLAREFPRAELVRDDESLGEWAASVVEAVAGRAVPAVPLDLRGTDFQRRVWAALQEVPVGTTVSYSQVAASIGKPKAVRAVASACGDNHVAVIVPCHRVVRSDGGIGGYKWGLERKRALLEAEGAPQQR
jgi:AraC family transcriptional regulator, regulatory protein of adaptative response / methylated-DNA-[protein]-cysteine methyltransferase